MRAHACFLMLLAGLILSTWGGFKRKIVTTLLGVIGIGLGVMIAGIAPAGLFWLLLVGNFVTGISQVFANGPLNAIFQSAVAPDMQGRVFSLIGAGAAAMVPLSLLVAGPVTDWLGIRVWYLVGGGLLAFNTPCKRDGRVRLGVNFPMVSNGNVLLRVCDVWVSRCCT